MKQIQILEYWSRIQFWTKLSVASPWVILTLILLLGANAKSYATSANYSATSNWLNILAASSSEQFCNGVNSSFTAPSDLVIAVDYCSDNVLENCDPACNNVSSLNIGTGIDEMGNALSCVPGTVDPFWRLINAPLLPNCNDPLFSTVDGRAFVMNHDNLHLSTPDAWANQPGAEPIAPVDGSCNTGFSCSNPLNTNGDRVPYVFERIFGVCYDDTVNINLGLEGDDQLTLELWDLANNTVIATSPTVNFTNFNNQITFWNFNTFLAAGTYAMRAKLSDTGGTVLGFTVAGTISSIDDVPSIVNDTACVSNNIIAVRKVLDNDCNGTFTSGDAVGENWTIELYDANNSLVQSGSTDINGDLFFNLVSEGTYTLVEVQQSGWYSGTPVGGSQTVIVDGSGIVRVAFYNCPDLCCLDEAAFNDRVDDGFVAVVDRDACSISVEPANLDDCHLVAWDFGDGVVTSYAPHSSSGLTHPYNESGQYDVCMLVQEINGQGEICWEGAYCETFIVDCSDCCKDEEGFLTNVNTGYTTSTDEDNCILSITPNALDSCHIVTWNWGDGTTTGPVAADAGVQTHTYNGSGTFNVCMSVEEVNDFGEVCWTAEYCDTVVMDCVECLNTNGDLNTYTGTLTDNNTFINNNVPGWFTAHGSPNYGGNRFTYIWSHNSRGEGVYTTYTFVPGQTYEITFDVQLNSTALPGGMLYLRATNTLSPSSSTTIPSTAGSDLVYSQAWSPTGWNTITVSYTPPAGSSYSQLWFYPFLSSTASTAAQQAVIQLDNVCVEEVNDSCPATLTVNDMPISDGLYQAGQTVNSAGQVPINGSVQFKAGQEVILQPGFSTEQQVEFSAEIEDCSNAGGN